MPPAISSPSATTSISHHLLPFSSTVQAFSFPSPSPFKPTYPFVVDRTPTWKLPLVLASIGDGVSTHQPRRKNQNKGKKGLGKRDGGEQLSEAEELVKFILGKSTIGEDKQKHEPLLTTLNKYVKVVRTDHCFLLFEELGRKDNWLQCLEGDTSMHVRVKKNLQGASVLVMVRVFRWMQKQRWYVADNGIYSKLISVMGKQGQTRMAMWLFSEMRSSGCRPDTSVYNALITAHLHSKDKVKALAKALGYFEKMKGMERCRPNIVTFNILLRAYAQAGDAKQVEALFKDLEASTFSLDIYTYNGVMDAYGKNGMLGEMESVLLHMKNNHCKPDIITFNLLIDAYGKRHAFDKMEQVFMSLLRSKEKPTLPTFNSMIRNYGKARLRDKAESVFLKMKELGYNPSYITYESLITTYGYCDCVSRAREIFDEMIETQKDVRVSTLNVMLDVYCTNGLPNEADQFLEYSSKKGFLVNSSTYKLLYKAYNKANDKRLLEKLLKIMDKHGIVPNKKFFLEALEDFGSSRNRSKSSTANRFTTKQDQPKAIAVQLGASRAIDKRVSAVGTVACE